MSTDVMDWSAFLRGGFQLLLTDGEVSGSMTGPDAKRRSVAYVLVFCSAAEILLGKKKKKQTVRNTI